MEAASLEKAKTFFDSDISKQFEYGSFQSELLGVAYTQIRNPDSNLSLLGRS